MIVYIAIFCLSTSLFPPVLRAGEPESGFDVRIRAAYWGLKPIGQAREQLRLLRQHGLNTALVKEGAYQLSEDLWRAWGTLAAENNIRLLPVINFFGPDERKHLQGFYRPYVDTRGTVFSATPCPFDANYWNAAIAERFVHLADLSKLTPIAGAIFDSEMYNSDMGLYEEYCFCDACWQEFSRTIQPEALHTSKDQRFAYLQQHQLEQAYAAFQDARLQAILSRIAQAIQRINPNFLLGFLAYRDHWFYRDLIQGLGTSEQPVLVFSETSYVRGFTPYTSEEKRTIGAKALHIPGLWLGRYFPEDLAAQLYACAAQTDGYWLFTAESLWPNGQRTGDYALHGTPDEYWAALQQANAEILRFAAQPDTYQSTLPPLFPSSYYDASQNRLITPPALYRFLQTVVSARIRPSGASTSQMTYRGKTLFHLLNTQGGTIRVTHIPLNRYTDPTQYKLFDRSGNLLHEGYLDQQQPVVEIPIPPTIDSVSLLTDSGSSATQATFSGLPYLIEASPTFPLATIKTMRTYMMYVPPERQRVVLFTSLSEGEAALMTIQSPDLRVDLSQNVSGLTELNIKPAGEAPPVVPFLNEQPVSPQDIDFWTITVASTPYEAFEDVQFYIANQEFPYVWVKE